MLNVLISDINQEVDDLIIQTITSCGHKIKSLRKDEASYRAIADLTPHLIVMEEIDDDSLQLIKEIRVGYQPDPIILGVFAKDPTIDLDALVDSGVDDIILPPLTPFRVESRIKLALQRAHLRLERQEMEIALRASEDRARAVLDTTVDGIITMDERCIIQSYNRAAEAIFGYTADEVVGQNVSMLMPQPYRGEHDEYVRSYQETNHKKIIGIGREVRGLRKNGEVFPLELAVSETKGEESLYTGIVRDISVRRTLELQLLQASEEERRRIGQDLHDGLGQTLTGLGLIAQNLARNLDAKKSEEAAEMFELVELLRNADEQARTIARSLVPIELENGGMKAATLRLQDRIQKLYKLQCTYEESGSIPELRSGIKTHFFRIMQEAMGNAARHSEATRIDVNIVGTPHQLKARIQDNGKGIDAKQAKSNGMGLKIMSHRANVIGATLDIRNGSNSGTVVTCTLPLDRHQNV